MAYFMVYPDGAKFDFALAPFGPRLVLATTDKAKALAVAADIGGTVEKYENGFAPVNVF